ncbi:HAD family hydrolase [Sulfitobacter mediterraneus]|uniref:phosphoglycolate phosphatase n=1 Tax=Sulfitobacter mediterraneus TaxID=83219 RepID=A0A061ST21_9RHOB|nr:HAD family hydrolase [Sulfitobacter mediterraneus]KAJ02400.1 phosphatase [Sulfitobacter mediterraneus]
MTDIKGLLFDKDGTLFDFAATWESWAHAFLLRACEGDHAKAGRVGGAIGFDMQERNFAPDSLVIASTAGEVTEALHPHFPQMSFAALEDMLNEEAANTQQQQAVPLIPLLTEFRRRGLALGVATNDAEMPARAHLLQAGILEMFDFVAGFDSGHGGKPAPGQMHAFAAQCGLPAAQIAMVGDSTHDLDAGRAAGMICVGVLTGPASRADLAPHADIVLPDIGYLPEWLDTQ